jgi:hypothetical protein
MEIEEYEKIYEDAHKNHKVSEKSMKQLLTEMSKMTHEQKSTMIGLIEHILQNKNFSPNECMALSLDVIKNEHDLGLLCVCLRHGANPNMYIDAHKIGPAHFLVAASKKLSRDLYAIFYCYMVLKGSNPQNPCFDPKAFDGVDIVPETVHVWLKNNGYELPSSATTIFDLIPRFPPRDKLCLSVLLDANYAIWDVQALEFMLIARNPDWKKVKYETKDTIYLKMAFKSTFPDFFKALFDDGFRPTYYDICYFISHMVTIYRIPHSYVLRNMCKEMIDCCVDRGVEFDIYQLDEMRNVDPEYVVDLEDKYKKPLWSKICSIKTDQYVPGELSETTIFFGIPEDIEKYELCSNFEEITSADVESLVKAFKKKNSREMGMRINMLTDFINATPEAHCDNYQSISGDAMEYSDKALAYYKDKDGKNWCFLSNSFESLLSRKINPINGRPLPREFLHSVEYQKRFLDDFGISLHEPKTIRSIIDKLKRNQDISNTKTDSILSRVTSLLEMNGTPKSKLMNMKIFELIRRLSNIDISLEDIIEIHDEDRDLQLKDFNKCLTSQMLYIIICRLVYDKMLEDITKMEKFIR